jgi:redox-sensitive bicupin YhaK (pirin superfamily)
MSWIAAPEPHCSEQSTEPAIDLVIEARVRHIDEFEVGRVLPAPARRMVGPFVFLDHMGPAALAPGHGFDVRPHPHIHLATVTYLFEGEVMHRDSVGSAQIIRPGAINWMTAGRGIVHSERTPPEARPHGTRMHGLQLWVALPRAHEDTEPGFSHHPADSLPELDDRGVRLRVLAGAAYGVTSPVPAFSPLFYVEATLDAGARLAVPTDHEERAVYVITGELTCGATRVLPRAMAVLRPGAPLVLEAVTPTRLVMIGGAPLDGPRYIWWNFVSSEKERIEQAARDWREGRFPKVPGDEIEFVPMDEEPRFSRSQR